MTATTEITGTAAEDFRSFDVTFPAPRIGATIRGLDLRQELSDETKADLKQVLAERGVLFLPDQPITADDQVRFARIFGELQERETFFGRTDESPYLEVLESHGRSSGTDVWHSDVTWQPEPPVATCLHSQIIPPSGGDTIWSSMTWAYAELSPHLKELINDATATHTWEKSIAGFVKNLENGDEIYKKQRAEYPPLERRIVERHPVTGLPLLYVNDLYTSHINGLPRSEGAAVLEHLVSRANVPEYQVRHKWEPNTVVIWDNLGVQHYAVTDYAPHYRKLHRLTINDSENTFKPVG